MRALSAVLTAASLALVCSSPRAQSLPPAFPPVGSPYHGDPRLERVPATPMHFGDTIVFGDGRRLKMRFPPRVNGQSCSDGDNHAELFVLFDEVSGLPVAGQLPILDSVPKGAANDVPDLIARRFSASWEVNVALMASTYDPADPLMAVDSIEALFDSPSLRRVYTTNLYLNCPVVPAGSTVDPGSPPIERALWRGNEISLLPYDLEDGVTHPQVMFQFVGADGQALPNPEHPHLVLSHVPGDPFYSSIWEVWSVVVPSGFPVTSLRSAADVANAHLPIRSANIRLNCPVVAVEDAVDSGSYTPMHFEDVFGLLRNDFSSGIGRFVPDDFRLDLPTGRSVQLLRDAFGEPIARTEVPAPFARARSFTITFLDLFPAPIFEPFFGLGTAFPQVAAGTNFVPVLLQKPFALTPQNQWPRTSSPEDCGELIRFTQQELEAAYRGNWPPRLPAAIEQNIQGFIANGLMDPMWAPGGQPYAARLALVGRALHEVVWRPEQGIQSIDTTSCVACHSLPAAGGASRGLYTLNAHGAGGDLQDTVNGGSMWGAGAAELLVEELRASGRDVTFAHGATGERDTIRHFVSKAQNAHFGIQSSEAIAEIAQCSVAAGATTDLDGDGVVAEATTGEVTAQAAFLLGLPPPAQADVAMLRTMGITLDSVWQGRRLFRQSIGAGGAGCAACHTPFHRLQRTVFLLGNPETTATVSVPVGSHLAEDDDVAEGLADFVGDQGLRTWGDFRLHKMGSRMRSAGSAASDIVKTAELWDVGSTYPLLRDGSKGSDLRSVILAHEGVVQSSVRIVAVPTSRALEARRTYTVKVQNLSAQPLFASPAQPLRLVLVGPMAPSSAIAEYPTGKAPDGTAREGAFWTIEKPIPAGGAVGLTISFRTASRQPLSFELALADHDGYSEAMASARAFRLLSAIDQRRIVDFLRAQLIGNANGE